jgi:hypothetical protein
LFVSELNPLIIDTVPQRHHRYLNSKHIITRFAIFGFFFSSTFDWLTFACIFTGCFRLQPCRDVSLHFLLCRSHYFHSNTQGTKKYTLRFNIALSRFSTSDFFRAKRLIFPFSRSASILPRLSDVISNTDKGKRSLHARKFAGGKRPLTFILGDTAPAPFGGKRRSWEHLSHMDKNT